MRGGVTTSPIEIVTPALVAQWKPALLEGVERRRDLDLRVALGEVVDDRRQLLLGDLEVDERVVLGQRLVEQRAPQAGLQPDRVARLPVLRRGPAQRRDRVVQAQGDLRLDVELTGVVGLDRLGDRAERAALAGRTVALDRQVVQPDHHVLRGRGDRTPVRRRQDVVRRQHEDAGLGLGLRGQRQVHGHLVTVEVRVERRADQRVDLDGLALDQLRLEGLDAEAVQRRAPGSAAPGAR